MNDRTYKKENIDGERGKLSSPRAVVVFIFYIVKSFGFYNYIIVVLGGKVGETGVCHMSHIQHTYVDIATENHFLYTL